MNKRPELNQVNAVAFLSRAKGYLVDKQFDKALADLDEALRQNPHCGEAWMVRATVHVEMGNDRQALADVEQRLRMTPPEPLALLTRANLRAQLGDYELAVGDFTEFLSSQPASVAALRGRSLTHARWQRFDEALADVDEALRLEPASAEIYVERGRVHQDRGAYAAARADYQKARELGPSDPRVYNQYAWFLAACLQPEYRDGALAVQLAQRACDLTGWQDGNILDTLASAYAECGRFDEALQWGTRALQLAGADVRDAVRGHLELFRAGHAARLERRA